MERIDEGFFADVGGVPQWLTIRGADQTQPAVLVIGGPGASFTALAPFFARWERHFTVVQWDQPGAGYTFAKTAVEPESIARLVDDGLRVAEIARARLRGPKLMVLSMSAGTLVGLQMVHRRPELFSAYIGSGQVVDWARQDALSYELLMRRARTLRHTAMLAELTTIGAPPYLDSATDAVKSQYAGAPTTREAAAFAELTPLVRAALEPVTAAAPPYLARELRWPEPFTRSLAVYTALRREIVSFDARKLGPTFGLPMFFLQGTDDLFTVTSEVERYAAALHAPHVEMLKIGAAGHCAAFLRDEVAALLVNRVCPRL